MASEIDTSESTLCRVIWDACKAADIGLAGMSWSGKNLHGTRASIDYAERAIRHYEQREVWSKEWLSRIEALAAERDAATSALAKAEGERDRLREGAEEALGCLNAAFAEGWTEALAEENMERIHDLWGRRISFAVPALEAALTPAQEAPKDGE